MTALLPYLGYGRQDRAAPGTSFGAAWAGGLLMAAGVDEVLTVDLHSAPAAACVPGPVRSLSPAALFAAEIARAGVEDLTIVAPDVGAVERCRAVAAAGVGAPVAHLEKERTAAGVVHRRIVGAVGRRAVLVDDILDTGGTLLSACEALRAAGAEEISIMATHGTLGGERWRGLPAADVRRVVLTDTVPGVRARAGDLFDVVPIAPLLLDALAGL